MDNTVQNKKCSRCKIVKPLTDYYIERHNKKDGLSSACKPCRTAQCYLARVRKQRIAENKVLYDEYRDVREHNMIFETSRAGAIDNNPKGLVIKNGWAFIQTHKGRISKDLKLCSIEALARVLELYSLKIEERSEELEWE